MQNSKHYNVDELFLYSHGFLNQAEAFAVDAHLLECEPCRNLFFRLLEEEGAVQQAETAVPENFTDTVMQRIACEPVRPIPKKAATKKLSRRQYLAGYAAVACLTLFLSWNGAFSPIANAGESIPGENPVPITEKQEKLSEAWNSFWSNIQHSSNEAKADIKEFLNETFSFDDNKNRE